MLTHEELAKKMLANPAVKEAYDAMAPEFALLDELLRARKEAGLSQAQVAALMGTKAPSIARLESALSSGKHSPSVSTLRKYAKAVGKELIIQLK
ncbi:helix-turn-helix transcriptional regulator [Fundidesulfovibrio butyratiphilus]